VELGLTMPTMIPHGRADVLGWAREADEGPWAALTVPERITYTSHSLTVELAAVAALTDRVPLWTTIVILPAHSAVQVAKDLASVDVLSGGRLTVGLGVGGREHDYRAVDAPFGRRWQRMDDQIAVMRRIWAGEPPFEGADPVGPPPVQPGGPPLVAGSMGPKALARAARWAVGVDHGATILGLQEQGGDPVGGLLGFDVAKLSAAVDAVRQAWVAAGRTDRPHQSASLFFALGPDAEERIRRYTYDYLSLVGSDFASAAARSATCWTPDVLRRTVAAAEEAGCDLVLLTSASAGVEEAPRARDVLFG
jgi:alkanesulfonate monooxygenase SsuD/methylene tetrahydromethanopterin reductase-like flavin-dependent oxidoreductase (luciferase family)